MAKISRLKLGGVRSFNPDEIQEIQFQSPVTLILGENGCGKTTIIEALKFACTGGTPGGQANKASFVFNPQLKSASKTKAVVKVKLIDSQGSQILINRAMRVEQVSPIKQSFIAADATFTIVDPNGKEQTISTRCSDLSKLICERLGVSESILNNVIFCHQDNSLWPLDEGKKVKERFDEIFDSAKYNKCVENINTYIRKERGNIKQIVEQLSSRRDKKDLVDRKRSQLHKDESELESVKSDIAKKEEEVLPIQQKLNEICKKEDNFTTLKQELSSKVTEKTNLQQHQAELQKKLKGEFKGTDEELEAEMKAFAEKLKNLPSMDQITKGTEKCNTLIKNCQVKIGELKAEKQQYNDMILNRNNNINSLGRELNLELNITANSNSHVGDIMNSLKDELNKSKNTIDDLQNKFTKDESLLQKDINKAREDIAQINQKISSNNTQIKQIGQKMRDVTLQLNRLGNSAEELKQLNNKIDQMDTDLKKLSESFSTEATEELIKADKQDIHKMEDKLASLDKDYKILQNNFELENNIETRTKDIREKENKVYELKNSHYDEFKILFDEMPESNIKMKVSEIINNNQKVVHDLQNSIEMKKAEVTKYETNIKFKKEELSSLENELETSLNKIKNVTKGQYYDEFYKRVEKELDIYQTSKGQLRAAKIMYEKFLQTFKSSKPCCPVCDTDFKENTSAITKIVDKIEATINNIPGQLTDMEEKLKKTQELFNAVQQTKPLYERTKTLKNNMISDVSTKLDNLHSDLTSSRSERDSLLDKLEKPRKIVDVATKVMSVATLIDKYQAEILIYKKEVAELQGEMTTIESEKSREEVEAEIDVCKRNISQKRQMCESNQTKLLEFRDRCQNIKDKRTRFLDKRLQVEKSMHGKPQLLEQQMELKGEEVILQDDIKSLENELVPAKEKLSNFDKNLENVKTKNRTEVSRKYDAYNKLNTTFQNISQLQCNIENIEKRDIDREFNDQITKQNQYKQELDSWSSKKDMVTSSSIRQRELQDNVDIRSKQKRIENISKVIAELEAQVHDCDHTNLLKEKHMVQAKYTAIIKETCTLNGKREQLEKNIEDQRKELERPEYKNAYDLYRRKYFELKIKEKDLRDLQIYSKGLENAIIEFHKEKMMNINSLIREYWRSIYRGNDIDYIQIKTEQSASTGTTSIRRTYNYKVIQVKNDTEIEMRGCCSAGQKVLACLIIRMALSTVFSHNCGILALDEPTTNLDRENILSLSETLAKMIQDRRVEKNFQLLVITHDEDFVRALSQTGSIESCLRVKRDHRGMSIVKKENIS